MGIGPRWSDSGDPPAPGNPDPLRFTILGSERIGDLWLSTLRYAGCTNFEGRKVMLTTWDPRGRTAIDPHFSVGSGILARFEPSEEGLRMATALAHWLARKDPNS